MDIGTEVAGGTGFFNTETPKSGGVFAGFRDTCPLGEAKSWLSPQERKRGKPPPSPPLPHNPTPPSLTGVSCLLGFVWDFWGPRSGIVLVGLHDVLRLLPLYWALSVFVNVLHVCVFVWVPPPFWFGA